MTAPHIPNPGPKGKILVIDDEALTLRTIGRALQAEGYEVRVAMSGEEGLKLFQEEATELALVDVVLPGIDGIEVLRQIKKRNSAAVVLMMSAYHMVDRAVESMKLGAYDYLIKPFHIADMLNTVRRASEMLTLHVRVRDSVQTEQGRYDFGKVVTRNPAYREMLEMARKAAEKAENLNLPRITRISADGNLHNLRPSETSAVKMIEIERIGINRRSRRERR